MRRKAGSDIQAAMDNQRHERLGARPYRRDGTHHRLEQRA